MRYLLFFIFIISQIISFSQQLTFKGEIKDAESNKNIPFVNIGFKNKSIGTLSDENGHFKLCVNKEILTDSLYFFCSGYHKKAVLLSEKDTLISILLTKKVTFLPQIDIQNNGKWINSKVGMDRHFPGVFGIAENDSTTDIVELGIVVGNNTNEHHKLKKLHLYLQVFKKDTCLFRVNLYGFKNGEVQERLNYPEILIRKPLESGWFEVDLDTFDLYFSDSIFIGVEFFPTFKRFGHFHTLSYGGVLLTNDICYKRNASFDTFKKLTFGSYSIYATISSFKKRKNKSGNR
jgi:hypothetical protein